MKNYIYTLMATVALFSASAVLAMEDDASSAEVTTRRIPLKEIPKELTVEHLEILKREGSLLMPDGEYVMEPTSGFIITGDVYYDSNSFLEYPLNELRKALKDDCYNAWMGLAREQEENRLCYELMLPDRGMALLDMNDEMFIRGMTECCFTLYLIKKPNIPFGVAPDTEKQ